MTVTSSRVRVELKLIHSFKLFASAQAQEMSWSVDNANDERPFRSVIDGLQSRLVHDEPDVWPRPRDHREHRMISPFGAGTVASVDKVRPLLKQQPKTPE